MGKFKEMRVKYPFLVAVLVLTLLPLGFVSLGYSNAANAEIPGLNSDLSAVITAEEPPSTSEFVRQDPQEDEKSGKREAS